MESMMSGLLAVAAGKQSPEHPFQPNHHHSDDFIFGFRQEGTVVSTDEEMSSSSSTETSPVRDSYGSSGVNSSSNSWSFSSNLPYYSPSCYSSPPTYIQGDFYNLSPPTLPSAPSRGSSPTSQSSLSFSIDAIIGSRDASAAVVDTPAEIYSAVNSSKTHVASGQFRFSPSDWSIFQPPIRPTSSVTSHPQHTYWCHVCEDFCSDVDTHQRTHYNNGDVCKLKRQFFNNHGYVSAHEQTGFLNRIKCGLCDKIVTHCFFSKHLRSHDGYICYVCGQECLSKSRLLDHMNKHNGLKPHVCKVCDQQFSDRRYLSNHARKHRDTAIQCYFCKKTFRTKYACSIHERIHTGNHPFACDVPGCKKSFPQKIQLRLHLNTHRKRGDL